MKKQTSSEPVELDLFCQLWIAEVKPPKGYHPNLLYDCYKRGLTKEEFFDQHVWLPF